MGNSLVCGSFDVPDTLFASLSCHLVPLGPPTSKILSTFILYSKCTLSFLYNCPFWLSIHWLLYPSTLLFVNVKRRALEITSMKKITLRIIRCYDLCNFPHVVKYSSAISSLIIVTVSSKEVLHFGESFLNWVEIWRVCRKVQNANTYVYTFPN